MEMYVSSYDRSVKFVIDAFESLQWSPQFDELGSFEVVVDKSYSSYFLDDYIVELSTDGLYQGIVEYLDDDDNEVNTITIKGHFMPTILSRRTLSNKLTFDNTKLETVVNEMLKRSFLSGDKARDLPLTVVYNPDSIRNTLVSCELSTESILDNLYTVVKQCYFGLNVYFDDNLTYTLTITEGQNKYEGENAIVLSKDYNTVNQFEYVHSSEGYKNFAYILGANDITTTVKVDESADNPLTRREIYIDLSSVEQGSLSTTNYKKVLEEQALIELQNYIITDSISVESNNVYEYGVDFNIGDYISVSDTKLDLSAIKQITGVSQIWDTSGYSIEIELGSQKGLIKYGK